MSIAASALGEMAIAAISPPASSASKPPKTRSTAAKADPAERPEAR